MLLGVRIHLEADEHRPAGAQELLENAKLDAVSAHLRVALAHEHETRVREPRAELGRRQERAGSGVGDGVEHQRRLAVLPRRIADGQPQNVFAEERRRQEGRGERAAKESQDFQGEIDTTSTGPSEKFNRSPGREPSRRSANSDWYE